MPRITREQQRLLVAEALRNLTRGVDLLEESDLCDLLIVEATGSGYWPRGEELGKRLRAVSEQVIAKLAGSPRYQPHRHLLQAVLDGSSIAAWAKEQGHARETVSRTTWREVTELVTRELFALKPVGR